MPTPPPLPVHPPENSKEIMRKYETKTEIQNERQ